MNATEVKFYILIFPAIAALFLINWLLDRRNTKEMKSEKEAQRKKVWWTFRSIRRGK